MHLLGKMSDDSFLVSAKDILLSYLKRLIEAMSLSATELEPLLEKRCRTEPILEIRVNVNKCRKRIDSSIFHFVKLPFYHRSDQMMWNILFHILNLLIV